VNHDYEAVSGGLVPGFVDTEIVGAVNESMGAIVRITLEPDFDRFEITGEVLVGRISFFDRFRPFWTVDDPPRTSQQERPYQPRCAATARRCARVSLVGGSGSIRAVT